MSPTPRAQLLRQLAERGDLQGFETLWLESMDTSPAEVGSLIAGVDALASQGQFEKAGLYLSMLSPVLLERELYDEALQVLRKMASVAPRERGLRHGLLTAYRALHGTNPRLERFLELCGLNESKDLAAAIEKLDTYLRFQPGAYLFHPGGWGSGRISEVDADEESLVIDFEEKRGHRMSMDMAAKKTELVPANDIRALKLDRMDEVRLLAENDPVELIRAALRSRRGKATLREVKDRLAGEGPKDVVPTKSWTKWWQKARTSVKGAPDLTITPGSNPTLELREQTGGYADACLRDMRLLPNASRQLRYFRDLMREALAHEDGADALKAVADTLIADAKSMTFPERVSLAYLLEEATQRFPGVTSPEDLAPPRVVSDPHQTLRALGDIPISGHRVSALLTIKKRGGIDWREYCQEVVRLGAPEAADHALADLIQQGHHKEANSVIGQVVDRYRDYPQAFIWYLRTARSNKLPASLRPERDPALLEKALVLHGHLDKEGMDKTAESEPRVLGRELIKVFPLKDYALVRDAFTAATESEAANLASLLRNNRSFNDDLRDRMLAHMFRTRPEAGRTEGSARTQVTNPLFDPAVLYTTARALQQKRVEYEDVVNNQIPENAAEIGRAASYGDLSENSEWTAAIEKQERLTKLAEDLRLGIAAARIIDGSLQDDSRKVALGSRVDVEDSQGRRHQFTILGPWDVDSNRGFISYLSPLGRALIGHAPGETVAFEVPSGTIEYKIHEVTDGLAAAEMTA